RFWSSAWDRAWLASRWSLSFSVVAAGTDALRPRQERVFGQAVPTAPCHERPERLISLINVRVPTCVTCYHRALNRVYRPSWSVLYGDSTISGYYVPSHLRVRVARHEGGTESRHHVRPGRSVHGLQQGRHRRDIIAAPRRGLAVHGGP